MILKFILGALAIPIAVIGLSLVITILMLPSCIGIIFEIDSPLPFVLNIPWLMVLFGILIVWVDK